MFVRMFLAITATLSAAPAIAGSLRVDPVRVSISDQQRAAVVTLTNMGDAPLSVHAYGLQWSQAHGRDQYSESAELIVSPPIATIPAKGTQLVRVGFRNSSVSRGAWRLVVEEVPNPSPDGGVQVALRMNLPLFAQLEAGAADELIWSARQSGGDWIVQAANPGDRYVRLDEAAFAKSTGIQHDRSIRLGTVLPHGVLEWHFDDDLLPIDADRFGRIVSGPVLDHALAVISSRN